MSDDEEVFLVEDDDFRIEETHLVENSEAFADKNLLMGYSVKTTEEIQETIDASITEVTETLEVSSGDAVALLRHFKWDMNKITEEWWSDPERCAKLVGLARAPKKKLIEEECPVCFDELSPSKTYSLQCGHGHCNECWANYLLDSLNNGPSCINTPCPCRGCKQSVSPDCWKKFLNRKDYNRFLKFNIEGYVANNPKRKWCPNPGCSNCIETAVSTHALPVECTCGFTWCFQCNDYELGDHAPSTCSEIVEWLKKCNAESENVKWMTANCKKCPKCDKHIEKNGGCMHMTCQKNSGGCGYEFCWLCRGAWAGHSTCNKSEETKRQEKKAADAKSELEHYMFYLHRYDSHKNALKVAEKQQKDADEKAEYLHKHGVSMQETRFLQEATQQLIKNRRMLQYSYVLAFYSSTKKIRKTEIELFQYLQNDLEHHTDKLSELYEKDIEAIVLEGMRTFLEWKKNVSNYTRVCKKFLQNFIDGVINKQLTCVCKEKWKKKKEKKKKKKEKGKEK